jgi:hypothetical protein
MVKHWLEVLTLHATAWGIPQSEVTALAALITAAEDCFTIAQSTDRTAVTTAQGKAAFGTLTKKMRFIKNHYFLKPPLKDEDFVALELKPTDNTKTTVPVPVNQPGLEIIKWGPHTLGVRCFTALTMGSDVSDHGVRIYYGIVENNTTITTDEPSMTHLTEDVYVLSSPPRTASDLPNSFFTRRIKNTLELPLSASGKVCYLAARFENGKGQSGPWGTMISTVVP